MRTILLSATFVLLGQAFSQTASIALVPWADGLTAPVDIAQCGDDRLFVVQQDGLVKIVTDSMVVLPTPFLDLTDSVLFSGEQGLLGLAFDPDYLSNGLFYVNYISETGGRHSRISRFSVSGNVNVADPTSEEILYTVDQPFENHKGGDLAFGPDGYLYVPFGDGGNIGDPLNNAQDLSDPLGDIIRIDVSGNSGYTVPASNPYVGQAGILPEIWSSGLRNPYRFGFDRLTGDMWLGDVGQGDWEEVDFKAAGTAGGDNYGWHCYEGFEPYDTDGCSAASAYDEPVAVHFNGGDGWCAIIGGRVYRGTRWPHLQGLYIYTDFCVGEFWSLQPQGGGIWADAPVLTDGAFAGWSCIEEDVDGELFAGNVQNGIIYKIIDACPMDRPTITFDGTTLTSSDADGYQWFLENDPIPGATDQSYQPQGNGSYFVLADLGGACELKSDVFMVLSTGINELKGVVTLTPNPANEQVTLIWDAPATVHALRVTDVNGREVAVGQSVIGERTVLDTQHLANGHYTIHFRDELGGTLAVSRLSVMP